MDKAFVATKFHQHFQTGQIPTRSLRRPHLIDRAAKSRGKNRTDFILDSARVAAEDTLLDQVIMTVSPHAFEQFQARLDMPPNPNERLLKTMLTPAPWERG